MGGKGRKRREKNYRAAHGGYSRLPPPPDRSKLDALPSKLRQLLSFTSNHSDSNKDTDTQINNNKNNAPKSEDPRKKQGGSKKEADPDTTAVRDEVDDDERDVMIPGAGDSGEDALQDRKEERKKRKRKKKQVEDLRFIKDLEASSSSTKKRERRKKLLEAKKKKQKKSTTEESFDFPGREKIEFGDVVQAPPKLVKVPKAFKNAPNASQERLRLQAIESYRKRKGWSLRPGVQLPPPVTM